MDKKLAAQILTALGSKVIGGAGKWVKASCPLAPWEHADGIDNNPSFGVSETGGYNCFTCGASGTEIAELIVDVQYRHKKKPGKDIDLKTAWELEGKIKPPIENIEFEDYDNMKDLTPKGQMMPFSESWLESFQKCFDHPYTLNRGIPWDVGCILDLRYDPSRERICFPIRDWRGTLVGLHGRDVTGEQFLRYYSYDYKGHRNPQVWLGEHHVADLTQPTILVEGPFDYAKVMPIYTNVLCGNMGKVSPYKLERLKDAVSLVTFYDYGVGGDNAREQVEKFCGTAISVNHIVPDEDTKDAGAMKYTEIQKILKDYGFDVNNDVLPEYLQDAEKPLDKPA